jgi:hypothetical protein
MEAEERTMYLVADSLSTAARWRSLFALLQTYATNRCVRDILNPIGGRAGGPSVQHLKGLVPCATSNFLRLNILAHVDQNDRCFDCHLKGTSWVCLNLGVFLCMRCAGLHRRLAIDHDEFHCDVRSLELGEFSDDELLGLELCGGNSRGVAILECKIPPGFRRPAESNERMLAYIVAKYIDQLYSEGESSTSRGRRDDLGIGHYTTYAIADDAEDSLSDEEQQ